MTQELPASPRFCSTCHHVSQLRSYSPEDESGYRCCAPEAVAATKQSIITGFNKKEFYQSGFCTQLRRDDWTDAQYCGSVGRWWKEREPAPIPYCPMPELPKLTKKAANKLDLDDL